jgi:hypothetical protein
MSESDDIGALAARLQGELERIFEIDEAGDLHGDTRSGALDILWSLRGEFESYSVEDLEDDDDANTLIDSSLDEISDGIEELDLYDVLPPLSLPDPLADTITDAPSRPLGASVKVRLLDFLDEYVPQRETLRALEEILDPDLDLDEDDEEQIEDADLLAQDFLLHDWRWTEGQSLIERMRDSELSFTDQEAIALQVMEHSHLDLYRVDDVDPERETLHLERVCDQTMVHMEVDDELTDVLTPGDGILARIYLWSDGPELSLSIPVDDPTISTLEQALEELENEDLGKPSTVTRAALLKGHGYLLGAELLFPSDEEEEEEEDDQGEEEDGEAIEVIDAEIAE